MVAWDVRAMENVGASSASGRVRATLACAFGAHEEGALFCIAAPASVGGSSGRLSRVLATGGGDETVRVWDARSRRAVGTLLKHKGSVGALTFVAPRGEALLSGGDDGVIIVWRTSNWTALIEMRGHVGRVNAIAPHPSGRLALSLGADSTLRLWDLTKGRSAFVTKTDMCGTALLWWPSTGARFYVLYDKYIDEHDGASGEKTRRFTPPEGYACGALAATPRLNAMLLIKSRGNKHLLAAGAEGGDVVLWDISDCDESTLIPPVMVLRTGHALRVRSLACVNIAPAASSSLLSEAGGQEKAEDYDDSSDGSEDDEDDRDFAPTARGFAALTAESIEFDAPADGGAALATIGGDGIVFLWDPAALIENFGPGASTGPQTKKTTLSSTAATPSKSAAAATIVDHTKLPPLAKLMAAKGTRPTSLLGV